MVKFSPITKEEVRTINAIAKRAVSVASKYTASHPGIEYQLPDAAMDITACHLNGCPLKLDALLDADGFNFAHDVFGIRQHINRETGKLQDFFLPRYAA